MTDYPKSEFPDLKLHNPVVPGSTLDDYLALNLSKPGAPYSEQQTVASLSEASEIRVFWTRRGRPVLMARQLTGTVFTYGKVSRLMVCEHLDHCPSLPADALHVAVAKYPSG